MAIPDRDFWVTTLLLGLFAGLSRLLYGWDETLIWPRVVGKLMTSILAAGIVRLFLWEQMADHPTTLLAITASCGWLGGDVIDLVVRRVFGTKEVLS